MDGCQNCGPFLGVHIKGDIDTDVEAPHSNYVMACLGLKCCKQNV